MSELIKPFPAPGWVGGFEQSNPAFAYPSRNLTSLPIYDNMANIDKLKRQQKVVWPQFSWLTEKDENGWIKDSRCYQRFAPDISRLGYDDSGRVYSIICPQQGASSPSLGSLNVEVTVTGNRGWVDETTKEVAADMGVKVKIWFAPGFLDKWPVNLIFNHFQAKGLKFPFNKANAIEIETLNPVNPEQHFLHLNKGLSQDFDIPMFAKHQKESWSVGHVEVQIGNV